VISRHALSRGSHNLIGEILDAQFRDGPGADALRIMLIGLHNTDDLFGNYFIYGMGAGFQWRDLSAASYASVITLIWSGPNADPLINRRSPQCRLLCHDHILTDMPVGS